MYQVRFALFQTVSDAASVPLLATDALEPDSVRALLSLLVVTALELDSGVSIELLELSPLQAISDVAIATTVKGIAARILLCIKKYPNTSPSLKCFAVAEGVTYTAFHHVVAVASRIVANRGEFFDGKLAVFVEH